MKILRLQFKNLNSLYGKWEIDFTNHSFQQDGLFVLSGPTGAGKSTILDAICLALYGQTPRLGKITQSSNEIMSKHTANCYSLLHFETNGTQYYARFEQRKAKNNPKGKLQDVERSIAKDSSDNIICRKKTDINDEIIHITGMDFSRFTRSILLAQGAFDSFLKARDEEKSMLLEQITGTEIYSEISKAVFDRAKDEREKTRELTFLTENAQILPPEEIDTLQKTLKENDTVLSALNNELNQITNCLDWLNQIEKLEEKAREEQKNYTELLAEQTNSQEKRIHFLNAKKAEKLFPEYTVLAKQKKELQDLEADLKQKEKSFPEQKKKLQALTEKFKQLQNEHQDQVEFYEKNSPLFDEIKKIDIILDAKKQNIITQKDQIQNEEQEYQKNIEELARLTDEKKAISENLAKLTSWINNNQYIAHLRQELSAIKQRIEHLKTTAENTVQIEKKIKKQQEALSSQIINKNLQEKKQKELLAEMEGNRKKLAEITHTIAVLLNNSLLEDLQDKLSLLQEKKILQVKIASLEEHRQNLQEGSPCPLCGSKEHPYVTDKNAIQKQSDIDNKIEQLDERIKEIIQLQNEQGKISERTINNGKQLDTITQNLEQLTVIIQEREQTVKELQTEKDTIQTAYEKQKQELEQQLTAFKIPAFAPQHAEEIITQLENNCTAWDKKNAEKQDTEQKLHEKDNAAKNIQLKQEVCFKNTEQKKQQLQTDQKEFDTAKAHREELFGEKNPADEEKKLQNRIKFLETERENYRQQKEQQNQEVIRIKEQISHVKTGIANAKEETAKNKEQFLQKMTEQGFISVEDFLNAYLEQDSIEKLQNFFDTLEQNIKISKNQLEKNTEILQKEKKKNLTPKTKQEIEEQKKTLNETRDELMQAQGQIKERLERNKKAVKDNNENIQKLEKQKKEQDKWELLNLLIGSADGKKFRTIAQAVTFEHVIHYANSKLQLLQQRYLLIQNEQNPLSLSVLDNYQGGEIRAIQNLSGGETFIVSLSLALGLAQMASQNVQVDSLFLDEGFGTLDEENLDTALSTLASIQQEGKLIGVISHIPLLKERITTQIDIIPNHNGKSIIEGAGCKKLA